MDALIGALLEDMKEILLNRMYVGRFLENNIGHEVINLFKDDNGSNYIYINPYGQLDKKHNEIESIFFSSRNKRNNGRNNCKSCRLDSDFGQCFAKRYS